MLSDPQQPAPPCDTIGLISDTHGLIRPAALSALAGVDLILHAGDIGKPSILETLEQLAPVVAVRGNTDAPPLSDRLPLTQAVERPWGLLYLLHDLAQLDLDPAAAGLAVVVHGHTHRPAIKEQQGLLLINPGSAGPRRFDLPVSVARLRHAQGQLEREIIELPR